MSIMITISLMSVNRKSIMITIIKNLFDSNQLIEKNFINYQKNSKFGQNTLVVSYFSLFCHFRHFRAILRPFSSKK